MRIKPNQQVYKIKLEYPSGLSRSVTVKGSSREVAEHRALKHNPNAIGIKREQ